MDTSAFVKYEDIVKLLQENDYYGLTVKRLDSSRLRHKITFASIKWYTIDIEVQTLKLDGDRIVVGTWIDGKETDGFDNFRKGLREIGKAHAAKRKQTVR